MDMTQLPDEAWPVATELDMWHFCNSCAQSLIKMNSNNDQFAEIQNKKAKYHSYSHVFMRRLSVPIV